MMEWFSVIKRRRKSMQGNIPHFYHWLTRVSRPKSQHTKEWLDKYCAWEDLPNPLKDYIKEFVFRNLKSNQGMQGASTQTRWGRQDKIPGIKLRWSGNNFELDEDYWNQWRSSMGGSHSEDVNWSIQRQMDNIYKYTQTELSYCYLFSHGREDEVYYHYNKRFYGKQPHKPAVRSGYYQRSMNK